MMITVASAKIEALIDCITANRGQHSSINDAMRAVKKLVDNRGDYDSATCQAALDRAVERGIITEAEAEAFWS